MGKRKKIPNRPTLKLTIRDEYGHVLFKIDKALEKGLKDFDKWLIEKLQKNDINRR